MTLYDIYAVPTRFCRRLTSNEIDYFFQLALICDSFYQVNVWPLNVSVVLKSFKERLFYQSANIFPQFA